MKTRKTFQVEADRRRYLIRLWLAATIGCALLPVASPWADTALGQRDARCSTNGEGACVVEFNLAASPGAYYRVQRFDPLDSRWVNVGGHDEPWEPGDVVEAGHFYRVAGCTDPDGARGCTRSRVFWAPLMPAEADIPAQVAVADGEGGRIWAAVTKSEPRAEQLRQLNVYLMSDALTQAAGIPGAQMTAPAPHSHAPGFPHDENMIHHDVYQQFNLLQEQLLKGEGE